MGNKKNNQIGIMTVCNEIISPAWGKKHQEMGAFPGWITLALLLLMQCGCGGSGDATNSDASEGVYTDVRGGSTLGSKYDEESGVRHEEKSSNDKGVPGDTYECNLSGGRAHSTTYEAEATREEIPANILEEKPGAKRRDACGGGWQYTGKNFLKVYPRSNASEYDEGVVYRHYANRAIKVQQATDEGVFVENDYLPGDEIWIEAQKRYEDGEMLGRGFYIRRGWMNDKNILGGRYKVARFVEVQDNDILEELQRQVAEEEGIPLEIEAPVKSLCGFTIGTTFSRVENLFKSVEEEQESGSRRHHGELVIFMTGELVTPFRYCGEARLGFSTNYPSGGQHLVRITLTGDLPWETFDTVQELREEVETIVSMLEKKFAIKFEKTEENTRPPLLNFYYISYQWETGDNDDSIWQNITVGILGNKVKVDFESELMSQKDWIAWKESLKPPKISADAGADLL